jgi:ElaB/YqjD/DUF883 family membrane-anchored ribosome-binding protein
MNGIFAALIAGAVALIVGSIKDRQSKNELYAQTVSSNRMEWIKEMRGYIVELIVLRRTINSNEKDERKRERNRIKLERCRANILMRLNPDRTNKDSGIENELREVLDEITIELIGKDSLNTESVEKFREAGEKLLKKAWERVKVEAGETIKKREDMFCRMEELE